ncbi:hypothetical protein [Paenibacillus xylanexedens]|uniref:hypothetical protein n=1 Tax=Paenibacillus xylanexedens TaxID=528191 RepID=UPI001C8DEADD|nr:hypothetical protein [Paenibacillus xylanexedens]MBY0119174.1 hypothetical protein [Paenibacillus xylanexedens]
MKNKFIRENNKSYYVIKRVDKSIIPKEVEIRCDLRNLTPSNGGGTIKLYRNNFCNPSFLEFSYKNDVLKIEEFYSFETRVGHGRFLLESLLEIIAFHNDYEAVFRPILTVKGKIKPKGITYEEALIIYDKCGFLKGNELYREIK